MRQARRDQRILCDGSTRKHRLFLSVSDVRKDTKDLIRDNANLLILFKQENGTNLKNVYTDHVNTDMFYENFCELCRCCWQQKYGFVVIDKDSALTKGRYRKGFNEYAIS